MCFKRKGCLSRFCLIRPKGVHIKSFCPSLNCLSPDCDYPHADKMYDKTDEDTGASGEGIFTWSNIASCEVDIKDSYYIYLLIMRNCSFIRRINYAQHTFFGYATRQIQKLSLTSLEFWLVRCIVNM